jgi:predicted HTH transcriptional regulator
MKENQQVGWKESWRDEYLRWVCGFATAEGGRPHIGRNERGVVVGVPNAARLLVDIPNKVRDTLGIVVEVNLHEEGGKEWLDIVVEPHPNPVSYTGEYHVRSGSTKQELRGAALDRFLLREAAGTPSPAIPYETNDYWFEFPFSADYVAAIRPAGPTRHDPTTQETAQEHEDTTQETTQERILAALRAEPKLTRRVIAERVGPSADGVKYHLGKLTGAGRIRHVGSTKAGRWEVLE